MPESLNEYNAQLHILIPAFEDWKKGLYLRRQRLAEYIQENQLYTEEGVSYLGSLKDANGKALFDEGFLNYLQRLKHLTT